MLDFLVLTEGYSLLCRLQSHCRSRLISSVNHLSHNGQIAQEIGCIQIARTRPALNAAGRANLQPGAAVVATEKLDDLATPYRRNGLKGSAWSRTHVERVDGAGNHGRRASSGRRRCLIGDDR